MKTLAVAALIVVVIAGSLSAYFVTHRFQFVATQDMVYVMDVWEREISVYAVGNKHEDVRGLRIHRLATMEVE